MGILLNIQSLLFSPEVEVILLPEATDKDTNKNSSFLQFVKDFYQTGGCLFLICDNHLYNFKFN
jgi:hypothetical protein